MATVRIWISDFHLDLTIRSDKNRDGNQHMIAFIAAGLGVLHIILHGNHFDIILVSYHIRNLINIDVKNR